MHTGLEGETGEPRVALGAEQHLPTSGQPEQASAVHTRVHPGVNLTRPQAPPTQGLLLATSNQSQVLLCGKLHQEVPSRKSR